MKNKKLTYILIPIVIVIWGYAILQLFKDEKQVNNNVSRPLIEDDTLFKDSLQFKKLQFYFQDPFLNRKIVKNKYSISNGSTFQKQKNNYIKKVTPLIKTQVKWPNISYGGTINNAKALITVNNKLEILNVMDEFESIKILNIYEDSIRVRYKQEDKTIIKNR